MDRWFDRVIRKVFSINDRSMLVERHYREVILKLALLYQVEAGPVINVYLV